MATPPPIDSYQARKYEEYQAGLDKVSSLLEIDKTRPMFDAMGDLQVGVSDHLKYVVYGGRNVTLTTVAGDPEYRELHLLTDSNLRFHGFVFRQLKYATHEIQYEIRCVDREHSIRGVLGAENEALPALENFLNNTPNLQ